MPENMLDSLRIVCQDSANMPRPTRSLARIKRAEEIGRRIRLARENVGLSVRELAGRLRVNISTVYRFEDGDTEHTIPQLERIARAIGCDPASLAFTENQEAKAV